MLYREKHSEAVQPLAWDLLWKGHTSQTGIEILLLKWMNNYTRKLLGIKHFN